MWTLAQSAATALHAGGRRQPPGGPALCRGVRGGQHSPLARAHVQVTAEIECPRGACIPRFPSVTAYWIIGMHATAGNELSYGCVCRLCARMLIWRGRVPITVVKPARWERLPSSNGATPEPASTSSNGEADLSTGETHASAQLHARAPDTIKTMSVSSALSFFLAAHAPRRL